MFKLLILILLGVTWVGLCIEGVGRVDDGSRIKRKVVIEPIDRIGTCDEGVARFRLSVQKKLGEQAFLHKYQEFLGQINSLGSKDKHEYFGLNVTRYKNRNNRNQQNSQLTEHVEPVQTNQKHVSILESIEEHHHQNKKNHKPNRKHYHCDQSHSGNFNDKSNPLSVSFFNESFVTSGEISAGDKQHFDTKRQGRITNSRDKFEFHPTEQMTQKLIQKPVNQRSRIKSKRQTDQIVLTKSQKTQCGISAWPHNKLKSKHIPHHLHLKLKPFYIEPRSVYSDSVESADRIIRSLKRNPSNYRCGFKTGAETTNQVITKNVE